MDSYEAARIVFSRIQSIDPDNASKIIAYILLQDQAEKEMVTLAFGPESLVRSVIKIAKTELGLLPNTSSAQPSSPPPPSPFASLSNPISISRPTNHRPHPLSLSSPRLAHKNNNGFNPSSSPSSPSVWSFSPSNNRHPLSPDAAHSLSYAAVVNGTGSANNGSLSSSLGSSQVSLHRDNFVDDYHLQDQNHPVLNDPLAFQTKNAEFVDQSYEMARSPGCRSDSVLYPPFWETSTGAADNGPHFHRRSYSVNDACFGTDDSTSGFGYKPCLYFARGFCKNGSSCRFVHGGFVDPLDNSAAIVGSPCNSDALDQCQQEFLRSKVVQQQRLAAAHYMAGVNFPYNKLNFLQSEAQRSAAAAAMMMGEELHKLNRCRLGRNDLIGMGLGDSNPGARQIYLTFPADSTFKEEDVSNYFSIYGPVQDVRIPYQQKRMFGFVTFVYPETVKIILAKGNPHFVCNSRVLVKPYKEKGKLPDKKQHQHDRSEFSSCLASPGFDREPLEINVGPRMFYNNPELGLRKKLEDNADWQQALEIQGKRLMNLQLADLKNHLRFQQSVPVECPSPTFVNHSEAHACSNHNMSVSSNRILQDSPEGDKVSPSVVPNGELQEEVNAASDRNNANIKVDSSQSADRDITESFEHILPDNLFASPTKLAGEDRSVFSAKPSDLDKSVGIQATSADKDLIMPPTPPLNMGPVKSCFLEMSSRFSSGHGTLGM